jgi:cystathionine beta-lyase/cystathionine gamma-synthase
VLGRPIVPTVDDALRPESLAVVAGRVPGDLGLSAPITTASTWASTSFDEAKQRAAGLRADGFYSRYANPTVRAFEEAVAELEGAEAALASASGMGALASAVFALAGSGDHIVAQRQLYGGTLAFLQGPCRRMGIEVTFVDGTAAGAFAQAVRPGRTMLVISESPSNPRLELVDLDELGSISGPFTLVDSTFATPLGQRPLDHGVDLVLHSATKGIAGHNDATLGVIAGEKELLDAIWAYAVLHGATPSPWDAHHALRGIRTLAVRVERQCSTAATLAASISSHPAVAEVLHPTLPSHPQHALAQRQLPRGVAILGLELRDGVDAVRRFLAGLRLARIATSLGGPDTLACHPATTTHAGLTNDEQAASGVTPGLVRLSVGLEHVDDLLADLSGALDAAAPE